MDRGDRTSEERFGGYVAGHQAACCAREAAVGEQCNGLGELGNTLDGGSDSEHLAHTGPTLRAFIADDENVARIDLAGFDRSVAGVFILKDAGRALVEDALVSCDLDDCALGCEVPLHDDEATGGLQRVIPVADDGLVRCLDGECCFLGERAAGDGDAVCVQQALLDEALSEDTRTACSLVVAGDVLAAGREVADERRALGDLVEDVHLRAAGVQLDAEFIGDRNKMQHGVGAAARGADCGDRVLDGLLGQNLARTHVVLAQV